MKKSKRRGKRKLEEGRRRDGGGEERYSEGGRERKGRGGTSARRSATFSFLSNSIKLLSRALPVVPNIVNLARLIAFTMSMALMSLCMILQSQLERIRRPFSQKGQTKAYIVIRKKVLLGRMVKCLELFSMESN